MSNWLDKPIAGFLLDISGVLKNGDIPIEGSIEALNTIQSMGIPYRLLTNETQLSKRLIHKHLVGMGFTISTHDLILSPAPALAHYLTENQFRPRLLIHERVLEDFAGNDQLDPNCLVIGDAVNQFTYQNMNEAFRFLMDDPSRKMFAMGKGKFYQENGQLTLDLGAFVAGLEYATGKEAEIFGKPSPTYFEAALQDLKLNKEQVVMIGDDISGDVGGAQRIGIRGILVRTGKYRDGDETKHGIRPDEVVDDFRDAITQFSLKGKRL